MTVFEKRGAMPDRKSLISTLWLTSSLVLLASVLVAPIRMSGFVTVSSGTDGLRPAFSPSSGQPASHLNSAMVADAVLEMNALPSDNEEQDRSDALNEPRVSFLIPRSFRKVPDRQLIATRTILSLYPLRC
jgi:hypothetical protein